MRIAFTLSDGLIARLRATAKRSRVPVSTLVEHGMAAALTTGIQVRTTEDQRTPNTVAPAVDEFPPLSEEEARAYGYDPTLSQKR